MLTLREKPIILRQASKETLKSILQTKQILLPRQITFIYKRVALEASLMPMEGLHIKLQIS